jgi:PKD repeat protein
VFPPRVRCVFGVLLACVLFHSKAQAASFANAVNYAIPAQGSGFAAADLNGDGNLDLITVNDTSNNISVLLGNADGTFQAALNYTVTSRPIAVAVGDFDADGKLDLAVADYGSNDISILLGNGDGTFQSPQTIAAGNNPRGIVAADFDGDHKIDLAIINVSDNTVSIFLGNGNGTFQSRVNYAVGSNPLGIDVGDVNGDHALDLVVANYFNNNVSVLLGKGDGTFQTATTFAAGANPGGVTLGDVNADGNLDVVVANANGGNVSVLLGNGTGSFGTAVNFAVGSDPGQIVIGDFDQDGRVDLILPNYNDADVTFLHGNGDGTFRSPQNFTAAAGSGAVLAGDFNHDGRPDLAVLDQQANTISVLLNTSFVALAMSPAPGSILTTPPSSIVVTLSSNLNASSVNASTVQLVRAGPDGVFGTADDVAVIPAGISVSGSTLTLDLTGVKLPNDKYQVILAHGSASPAPGLLANWKLDEGSGTAAVDSSGYTNTGTLNNGASRTAGLFGNAVNFDGVTGAIKIPQSPSLEHANGITVSLWGNISNTLGGGVGDLLRKEAPFVGGYVLRWNNGNGHMGFHIDGNTAGQFWVCEDPTPNSTYLNAWHHYVGTYDCASQTLKLYVDGVLKNTVPGGLATLQHTDDLYLMFVNYGSQVAVPGTLDEIRIYDHALSGAEITALFKNGITDANGNSLDGKYTGTFPSGDGTFADFAASFTIAAPALRITALTPPPNVVLGTAPASIVTTFSENIDPSTINADNVSLIGAGPDGQFGTSDDVILTPGSMNVSGNQLTLNLNVQAPPSGINKITLSSRPHGRALHFDGSGQFVNCPFNSSFAIANEITVESWFKFEAGGTQNPRLVNRSDLVWEMYTAGTGASRQVHAQITLANGAFFNLQSTSTLLAGQWHHAAFTYNQSVFDLYVDGILEAESFVNGPMAISNFPINIGKKSSQSSDFFQGDVDEVRVWNVARSQAQIQSTLHIPASGLEPGLVLGWNLDEFSGQTIFDVSPNVNNGTLGADTNAATDDPARVMSTAPITKGIQDINTNPLDGKFPGLSGGFPSGDGTFADFVATFTIDIPVAANQSVGVHSGALLPIALSATDSANNALTYSVVTPPAHGTLSGTPPNVTYSTTGYAGPDSFTFKANNGFADSNTATVTINVTDAAPIAVAQNVIVHSGVALPIALVATDADNDVLSYSIVTPPAHGTLSGTLPNVFYTSDAYSGPDSFTFAAKDGVASSNVATVAINLTNIAPSISSASASPTVVIIGQSVDFTAAASDADGDVLAYLWDFGDGATSSDATTSHSYSAAGIYSATITVTDFAGAAASQSITINVFHDSDRPTARFTSSDLNGFVGQPLGFDATFSTDPKNDIVSYAWDFGDSSRNGSGQLISRIYTAVGTYTITLTVTDAEGLSDTTTLTMVVLPAAQAGSLNPNIKYSVSWNRGASNADTLNLSATVNVGTTPLSSASTLSLRVVGQTFAGTSTTKLAHAFAALSGPRSRFQIKANTKKGVPKGTYDLKCSIKHASLGLAFALAGVTGTTTSTARIPIRLSIGASSFESSILSQFRFGSNGAKATGGGQGPK